MTPEEWAKANAELTLMELAGMLDRYKDDLPLTRVITEAINRRLSGKGKE